MKEHLINPNYNSEILIDVTPESAGWDYLSFKVVALKTGEKYEQATGGNEVALVPLKGQATLTANEEQFEVYRQMEVIIGQRLHVSEKQSLQ